MYQMLSEFIEKHQLPDAFRETALQYYVPLADTLAAQQKHYTSPFFVGINGCQGSGKSTMSAFIAAYLAQEYQLNVINLSLDDFYLSKKARKILAEQTHPLLATRGVPGTHDIKKLKHTLVALKHGETGIYLPAFDKAMDDLKHVLDWPYVEARPNIVLLEGWCWGVTGQSKAELSIDANPLEQQKDADGVWRNYVNDQLETYYQPLYVFFDYWVMLAAPSFDAVYQWRLEQEEKLAVNQDSKQTNIMSAQQIKDFIAYFQRLTEHGLSTLPSRMNYQLVLDDNRSIKQVIVGD
ncbi:kinase [Thalassotalea sediminis]|uniref:kinase n=1 Tax=Thalassotalea sediminis TaxID=1759089 RepID=UPI002572AC34|nr:kinase [Thalassotalea sediminis]